MIAYASYRPQHGDVANNSFITALIDGGISYFAGFAVFSTVGYLAVLSGAPVPEAVSSGFGLAFVAYPTAISAMPFAPGLFGAIFFLMLLTLGIDSAFAMVEAVIGALRDRWKISKLKAARIVCFAGLILGLPFCFSSGYHWLDIVDHWITVWGLAVVGLLQCIAVGWLFPIEQLRTYVNEVSDFRIGRWWILSIRWVTPAVLLVIIGQELLRELRQTYGGYPSWSVWIGGWLVTALLVGVSLLLQMRSPGPKRNSAPLMPKEE